MLSKFQGYIRRHYWPERAPGGHSSGLLATGILVALVALLLEFFGWQRPFMQIIVPMFDLGTLPPNELTLLSQVYTSGCFIVLLVLIPCLFHVVAPLEGSNPYGLSTANFTQNMKRYYPLLIIMLPVVWIACGSPSFSQFYPLYKPETLTLFLVYEAIYLSQFFAVEFFYRGFCLFRFERIAPGVAVFIMVIPYALLHIHKPFPEAIGSIVAGLVLGVLALKSRSIWPGVLTHCTVAFSADFFSLWRSGRLLELLG